MTPVAPVECEANKVWAEEGEDDQAGLGGGEEDKLGECNLMFETGLLHNL